MCVCICVCVCIYIYIYKNTTTPCVNACVRVYVTLTLPLSVLRLPLRHTATYVSPKCPSLSRLTPASSFIGTLRTPRQPDVREPGPSLAPPRLGLRSTCVRWRIWLRALLLPPFPPFFPHPR